MGHLFSGLGRVWTHFHTRPKIKFKKNQKKSKKNIKNNPLKNKTKKPFSQLFIVSCLLLLYLKKKNPKKSSCNKVLQLLLCNLNPNNKADKLVKVGPTILWPLSMWEI